LTKAPAWGLTSAGLSLSGTNINPTLPREIFIRAQNFFGARQPNSRRRVSYSELAPGTPELTIEHELIGRAQGGDIDAFCRLAREYERRVYALALHYCRHAEDAEDLSQEVWLKAFKSLGGFRFESSFYTWLRRIMVNALLNHRRALTVTRDNEKTIVRLDSLEELLGEQTLARGLASETAEDDFQRGIMVARVMRALSELTEQQRLIFLLKHREGMTCQEIADVLGCSAGSVKKSLFRSIEKLRSSFGLDAEAEGRVPLGAGEKS
jgi:RNA polymerase sigma-70 factor (ECF subfamily)